MERLSRVFSVDVVTRLGEQIHLVLQSLLPRGTHCALLDFPDYSNVGDSAIWLGEKQCLRNLGASVVYTASIDRPWSASTFDEEALARRVRSGTILLSGGGNFGDLWIHHQYFRERVIAGFPNNKIIQLPQSIHFEDKGNLARARSICNGHPDLILLVRDQRSLEFARNEFKARSLLCPDMAFALGPISRPERPKQDIVWLGRTDKEVSPDAVPPTHVYDAFEVIDWLRDYPSITLRFDRFLSRQRNNHPRVFKMIIPLLLGTHGLFSLQDRLAKERVIRGCRNLSRGKVVITDRLHGHILSLLLGIPHVVLDNNYGKLSSFYETWTKGCALTYWAKTSEEALEMAGSLI